MSKPLLLSLAASLLIAGSDLSAQSMLERFEAMEKEMSRLRAEIAALKEAANTTSMEDKEDEPAKVSAQESKDAGLNVAAAPEAKKEDGDEDMPSVEDRLFDIEESLAELNRNTSGSHLKFQVDYRFAVENMNYEMADGTKHSNDAFMTNRLWIDAGYQATNNLSFTAQLAYNKAFGERSGANAPADAALEGFDWIANENAYDDKIRVRSAYFFYKDMEFMGYDIPWTFSIGRRPSTNGHLVNLRDDDTASSPLGHSINVEFDGLSSKFTLNKRYGTYLKFCAGRGMSEAAPKFAYTPYADDIDANSNIDLVGLIFAPVDTRKYGLYTQYYYANNLIDVVNPADYTQGFETVGGMHSGTVSFLLSGIGDEWSEFLDYTKLFASFSFSKTDPKDGAAQGMLGSSESKTGTSLWVGAQFPSLISEYGKWGVEYNHGSKYFRSMTYGEDTNIGSKLAVRGDAYEAYMTEYLVEDILSLQLRYTYIDYKYTGSNGFFGDTTGTPMTMSEAISAGMGDRVVDKAQDIRLYLRYKY